MYYRLQILNLSLHPGNLALFIADRLGTKKQKKKKGKPLVFSNSNLERENTVYSTFFVLKGNDSVRTGEFNVFEVQESLEEVLLHPRTPVSELKDGSLLVKAHCGSDSRALSKLVPSLIDLSPLLPIIALTVVKAQYFM